MKPSSKKNKTTFLPFILLLIQPIFMASNLAIARGAVPFVPPVSLGFWRWTLVFVFLLPFFYEPIRKNFKHLKSEFLKLFFLGSQTSKAIQYFSC